MTKMLCEFTVEYETLGHMQHMQSVPKFPICVLLHYGLYRAESSTTKLLIVMDASTPSSLGFSLNDCLKNRGVVQDDLFSILL